MTDEEHEELGLWMTIYGSLLEFGLDLFEPDGIVNGDGINMDIGLGCLIDLRTFFEQREFYGRAEFVNDLINEYKKRWPDAYNIEHRQL